MDNELSTFNMNLNEEMQNRSKNRNENTNTMRVKIKLSIPKKSTLNDFKKPQYKNQIYSELAWVATNLAGLETLPRKQLTDRWRAAESELTE